MEKNKINRLIEILNEAKEIIAELEGYTTKKEKQAKTIEQILATNIREFGFIQELIWKCPSALIILPNLSLCPCGVPKDVPVW